MLRLWKKTESNKSHFSHFKQKTATLSTLAGHALHLMLAPNHLYGILVQKRLDPAFREEIMVAVATLNACKYCNYAHHDFALQAGVSKEDLAQLEGISIDEYDEIKFLAITYARELANRDFGEINQDLERKMKQEYSQIERGDIQTTARIIMLFSLLCNTADAFIERLSGDPVEGSPLIDEMVIAGSFFGFILPVVGIYLSVLRKESPLKTMKDFTRFSQQYQATNL